MAFKHDKDFGDRMDAQQKARQALVERYRAKTTENADPDAAKKLQDIAAQRAARDERRALSEQIRRERVAKERADRIEAEKKRAAEEKAEAARRAKKAEAERRAAAEAARIAESDRQLISEFVAGRLAVAA